MQLDFEALRRRFSLRRELLEGTIGTVEVTTLLGTRSRQIAHDRIKAGTLLAIRDHGHWRFPLWQSDPEEPNGVIAHLPEVLNAMPVSELAKLSWLQRPQPVLAEARQVGRS